MKNVQKIADQIFKDSFILCLQIIKVKSYTDIRRAKSIADRLSKVLRFKVIYDTISFPTPFEPFIDYKASSRDKLTINYRPNRKSRIVVLNCKFEDREEEISNVLKQLK